MPKDSDYFNQKFREDARLRSSWAAVLDEFKQEVLLELVNMLDTHEIFRKQGTIKGIERLQKRMLGMAAGNAQTDKS